MNEATPVNMAAGGVGWRSTCWGWGGGAWVAAAAQVENTNEVKERELEENANNQRMYEWVRLQSLIHLSTDERRGLLAAMAL